VRYAQFKSGRKLHIVCEPGEEYRGEVIRVGNLSWPLCGYRYADHYRMTINVPLRNACKKCVQVRDRTGQP
jgi:hypothetical protein